MRRKRTLARMLPRLHLLYASHTIPRVYWPIYSFQRVSREARPKHGGENLLAVWPSPHEERCSDGAVAPHGCALLVGPDLGAVRDRGTPAGGSQGRQPEDYAGLMRRMWCIMPTLGRRLSAEGGSAAQGLPTFTEMRHA